MKLQEVAGHQHNPGLHQREAGIDNIRKLVAALDRAKAKATEASDVKTNWNTAIQQHNLSGDITIIQHYDDDPDVEEYQLAMMIAQRHFERELKGVPNLVIEDTGSIHGRVIDDIKVSGGGFDAIERLEVTQLLFIRIYPPTGSSGDWTDGARHGIHLLSNGLL